MKRSLILVAACASLPIAGALAQDKGPPASPVAAAEARVVALAPTAWLPGTVVGRDDARVGAEVEGRLKWVAEVGAAVKAGEVIARLDDTELQLAVAEGEAVANRDKARLAFAGQELARISKLVSESLLTRSQLDQAVSARDAAQGEYRASRARLDLYRDRLERSRLKAPFDGVVTERLQRAGERVEAGMAVIRVVNPAALEVQVNVPADSLPYMPVGTGVRLRTNGREAPAHVRAVVPVGDDRSRLYDVRLSFEQPAWPAGTTLRVAVPTAGQREVVAVPRDALVLRREGAIVFRVKADMTVERVMVNLGVADGPLIEVQGGIQAGDRVVIRGGERLFPGQKVRLLEG